LWRSVGESTVIMSDTPAAERDGRSAAFFDVDGTIVSTHIVHQYLCVRRLLRERRGGVAWRLFHPLWLAGFFGRCIRYLYLDRVSRTRMNIAFYRNYAGLDVEEVRRAASACFERVLKPNLFVNAARCVREHRAAGRRVVLVTGSIDFLIEPLAHHLESQAHDQNGVELIARTLTASNGRFTGALDGPPIGEQEKAAQVRRYAESAGINLAECYAYGDSVADLPMLELVGTPVAVNADKRLSEIARQRGWRCEAWRGKVQQQ
jgi:HAD superfamily hydrolase (TIGR01490 family)